MAMCFWNFARSKELPISPKERESHCGLLLASQTKNPSYIELRTFGCMPYDFTQCVPFILTRNHDPTRLID